MSPLRCAAAALFLTLASTISAATFTVTSSDDSGPGTLRQAMLDANANPGLDRMIFAVDFVEIAYPPARALQAAVSRTFKPRLRLATRATNRRRSWRTARRIRHLFGVR
jgi:hypothetical protein